MIELRTQPVMVNTDGYGVSDRYQVINTMDVVSRFEQFGFELSSVTSANTRHLDKVGKQPHMVRMAAEFDLAPGLRPEVIIHNSYDGTKALNIRVGVFRFVCSNGIIVGTNLVPNMQILHSNTHWSDLIDEFIDGYEEKNRMQGEWIETMQERKMTLDEAYYLAEQALGFRHADKRIINDAVDPLELLIAKRKEDRGRDAWSFFNRMQEHMILGEYSKYDNEGSIRKAKILTNVDEIIRVNVELSDFFTEAI